MRTNKTISTLLFALLLKCGFSQSIGYATYFGGSKSDDLGWLKTFSIGSTGNLYFALNTTSTNSPVTDNAFDKTYNGGENDLVVVSFNLKENKVEYASYLGGTTLNEYATQVLLANNRVYLVGNTGASNFPATSNAYDQVFNGPASIHSDGFLAFFDSTQLAYSSFIGTTGVYEWMNNMFVEEDGEMVVVGALRNWDELQFTHSFSSEKITDSPNACILRFNAKGDSVLSATLLGPTWADLSSVRDNNGYIYLTGLTSSANFPTTTGAYDTSHNGPNDFWAGDVFVMKLTPNADQIIFSTFLGGSSDEGAPSICLDNSGNIVVSGYTASKDFPITSDALDKSFDGASEYFISKISADGQRLLYSSFIGGTETGSYSDINGKIVKASNGDIYFCGFTDAPDFPVTSNAISATKKGGVDVVLCQFDSTLTQLKFSTYIGGSKDDYAIIELDQDNNPILLGYTNSTDFPVTAGCYDSSYNGGSYDLFIVQLNMGSQSGIFQEKKSKPTIYYSPMKKQIIIESIDGFGPEATFTITDLWGRTISQGKLEGRAVDLTYVRKGMYILSVESGEKTWQAKVMVE